MRQFFAFAICFALLFQVWWRHFNFFRRYGLEDVPTIVLTGVLLFVVLFYVYPLKFVFTLVVNQIIGVAPSHEATGGPVIRNADTPRLMQIYSRRGVSALRMTGPDRKSTRLNSSHLGNSYAVFCLKKK